MNTESLENNSNKPRKNLSALDTQSLSSNEDATERRSTPRVSRHSHKNADDHVKKVDSDEDNSENDSENDSEEESDYDTDSTGSSTSYVEIQDNPMYLVMSTFLESSDPENRVNVTEAILNLKSSVDRVADMLEKLVTLQSSNNQ